jgi:uncharacterized membrane protein
LFHRPVASANASRYVLLMLLAFAITVVGTRLYLEATGYPQIGNATFHFAHALWGGLLLVIASLLLLIYVNRWIYSLSSILAGVGVGLFIDEVGKFITQRNDYFFPLAAPIIYVAFLLILLAYLLVRREPSTNTRTDMYKVLSDLEEVLEDDLSVSERDFMLTRLQPITLQTERPDLAELARHITAFLQSDAVTVIPDRESPGSRLLEKFRQLEERFLPQRRTRYLLIAVFLIDGVVTLFGLLLLVGLITGSPLLQAELVQSILADNANVRSMTSLNWYMVMSALEILSGVLIFAGALAFLIRRDQQAIALGVMALLISLIFTNTLSFYFDQFSVLLDSIYSFLALLALERYRARFLKESLVSHG